MMPMTVPKRPMKGAALPVVARKLSPRSRRSSSSDPDQRMWRASASTWAASSFVASDLPAKRAMRFISL